MVVAPETDIILIKSPLKLDNNNQITFSNADEQYAYFTNLPKLYYDECTYQRKDGVIRYKTGENLRYEDLLQYNYCMYRNSSYSLKVFYAFITDVKYVNDGLSEVTIETDVFQTWQFDIQYMNSFIEREHVSNDTPGLHTIPENLELGDYVMNTSNKCHALTINSILVASTIDLSTYASDGGDRYGGVFQGYNLYRFSNTASGVLALQNILMQMNVDQKLDAIVGIYLCNPFFYETDSVSEGAKVTPSSTPRGFTWGSQDPSDSEITKLTTLNGYTPKNGKLKTYPYMYLLLDNGNGGQATYKFELFQDPVTPNVCGFDITGTPSMGGSYFALPTNYGLTSGGVGENYTERLAGGKLPTCGFQNDTYINWLTQNAVSLTTGVISDAVQIGTGAGMLAGGQVYGASSVMSGISGILNTMYSTHVHSLTPPQHVGNTQTGDVNFVMGLTTFTAYSMSIKYEFAKTIDDYFTMYGYKVNRLATPNIHKRSNWDYIKCIDVNLEGNIPEKDLDKIRSLFNNGCTFWHTTSYYLDYSRTNSIL